jgi:hypothetical protein
MKMLPKTQLKIKQFINFIYSCPLYKQEGWIPQPKNDIPYFPFTLAFSLFIFVLEYYLDLRQLKKFKKAKNVPKALVGKNINSNSIAMKI